MRILPISCSLIHLIMPSPNLKPLAGSPALTTAAVKFDKGNLTDAFFEK